MLGLSNIFDVVLELHFVVICSRILLRIIAVECFVY